MKRTILLLLLSCGVAGVALGASIQQNRFTTNQVQTNITAQTFVATNGITDQSIGASKVVRTDANGTLQDVRAWNRGSFGYRTSGADINAGGLFVRTKAGDFAYGVSLVDTHGTANGTFIDAEADGVSFGRLIASGTFLRCRYVAISGTAGVMYAADTTRSGTFIDCLDNAGIWFSDTASGSVLKLVDPTLSGSTTIPSGVNKRAGNATLISGTVTVTNTTVTTNTLVFHARKTAGGTLGMATTYTTSAGASFTLTSDNVLDTSTFSYMLIENP